jgi:hypothetical protein
MQGEDPSKVRQPCLRGLSRFFLKRAYRVDREKRTVVDQTVTRGRRPETR